MFINRLIKRILYYSGVLEVLQFFIISRLPICMILRYHSIIADSKDEFICVTPSVTMLKSEFEKQIRYLTKRYNILSLEQLIDGIKEKKVVPENSMVITFDDGYRDNYLYAYPILKKYNAIATIYLTVDHIGNNSMLWMHKVIYLLNNARVKQVTINGVDFKIETKLEKKDAELKITSMMKKINQDKRDGFLAELAQKLEVEIGDNIDNAMMSWGDAREMMKDGFLFGSHTLSHCNLPNSLHVTNELLISKEKMERNLNCKVNLFSYPNGGAESYYNEEIKQKVKMSGYICATTSLCGVVAVESDLFELRRKGVPKGTRLDELAAEIAFEKMSWWIRSFVLRMLSEISKRRDK
ncbi:MAG: polysaccharide deacetylase family protein [Candidatus Desantisbacteria bacterium]